MNKSTLLIWITGILILLNAALLFSIYGKRKGGKKEPKKYIIHQLRFDKMQVSQYEELIKEHRESIRSLDKRLRREKHALYTSLRNGEQSKKDSIINHIKDIHGSIDSTHYDHFTKIKELCRGEQVELFDELTDDLSKLFAPPRPLKKK